MMGPTPDSWTDYPLLKALTERRSRRFAPGMAIPGGPLAFKSRRPPQPLSEEEEAILVFAACGITGYALGDLAYVDGQGGNIMGGLVGSTTPSADALNNIVLVVVNDQATYVIKRPQDLTATEIRELIELGREHEFTEAYRRRRVKIQDGRVAPPLEPMATLDTNRWSLFKPGTTYFLPIGDFSGFLINSLLECLNESTGMFIVDERAMLRPAGLKRFMKSKGGHLRDDPKDLRMVSVRMAETILAELAAAEAGMMLQNIALTAHALGLGGFPHWAAHPFEWFTALGFRMEQSRYTVSMGVTPFVSRMAGLFGREVKVPSPVALERDGNVLVKPFCPPYYPSVEAAVRAAVDRKFGADGVFRGRAGGSSWRDVAAVRSQIPDISATAVEATIACCEYLYKSYGRLPPFLSAFRTVMGFQACCLDAEFYDRFYQPEALSDTQRQHMAQRHAGAADRQ